MHCMLQVLSVAAVSLDDEKAYTLLDTYSTYGP